MPVHPDPLPWHALLAPLPADATPRASPVAPPSVQAEAIAGWISLVLELSAGPAGLRIVHVLVDAAGRPLSASDHVLFRSEPMLPGEATRMRQESIGGRFEDDGSFRGTCWLVSGPEPVDEGVPDWDMAPRTPTESEVEKLKALVGEMLRRRPLA
jgi:hypothetical protein